MRKLFTFLLVATIVLSHSCTESGIENDAMNGNKIKLSATQVEVDFEGETESFDLIYSASAFHEVDQAAGYTKAFELLKSGGVFVRFSNHEMRDIARPNLAAALQKLYSIYLPRTGTPKPYKEAQAQKRAELALKYGFVDVSAKRYYRTRTYTTEDFLAYLATDADHLKLSETKRTAFFNEIRKTLTRYGGKITMYDTIDLQIAKKP